MEMELQDKSERSLHLASPEFRHLDWTNICSARAGRSFQKDFVFLPILPDRPPPFPFPLPPTLPALDSPVLEAGEDAR